MLSVLSPEGNGNDKSDKGDKLKKQLIFKVMVGIVTGSIYFDNQTFFDFNEVIRYIENLSINR